MSLFLLTLWCIIWITSGLIFFIHGFKVFKKKKIIEGTPTSKIRSLPIGLVEIRGEVIPAEGRIFKAPFTNEDCVYYKCVVQEEKRGRRGQRIWITVKEEEKRDYFYLRDETDLVLVDPRGAEVDLPANFEFKSGGDKEPPEPVKAYLLNNNISFQDNFGNSKTMKFYEYHIAPKDKLFIMGYAGDNPFVKEGWALRGVEDIMIQKGGEIYYISNRSEKEILSRLKKRSLMEIILGAIIIVIGVVVILLYFRLL